MSLHTTAPLALRPIKHSSFSFTVAGYIDLCTTPTSANHEWRGENTQTKEFHYQLGLRHLFTSSFEPLIVCNTNSSV